MPERVLITGGCGFVGHHVVEHILKNTDWEIVVADRMSNGCFGIDRLRDISVMDWERVRVSFVDFSYRLGNKEELLLGKPDYVLHLAAESHVDRSITDPLSFVRSNVLGTAHLLEWVRRAKPRKMIYMSTDEVFGPAVNGELFKEWDRYNSTNPYAATKAGAEELCLAWANTYGMPVSIIHSMNVFGERQHPEKFIPKVIGKVLAGETVHIHANKEKTKAGSRFWIHARNVADALLFLLKNGEAREKYNVVGDVELDNLSLALFIAEVLGKELKYQMVDFHSSRPGHDLRYSLDGSKMSLMGWNPPKNFRDSLAKTIRWSIAPENGEWCRQAYASVAR